jgi:hypothetical protein
LAITKHTKDFIVSLIEYYTSEASSYRQIAQSYSPEITSVEDAAFGIITGCIYSAFLRAYENENKTVELDDIQEFNAILKEKALDIKNAIKKTPE